MSGIKIIPSKHFIERLGERMLDLSVIAKLHMELAKQPDARILKVSAGNTTIVAEIKGNGIVRLITGWINKKNKMKMEE